MVIYLENVACRIINRTRSTAIGQRRRRPAASMQSLNVEHTQKKKNTLNHQCKLLNLE